MSTSSFVDLTHVGSGKANGISGNNLAEASRQFQKGIINSANHHNGRRDRDIFNAWKMASTPYNPWGKQLQNAIRVPNEIYTNTPIAVTGFEGGSTLYIEAGKLHKAGMSIDQILAGVTAEDIHVLLTRGDLELDLVRH